MLDRRSLGMLAGMLLMIGGAGGLVIWMITTMPASPPIASSPIASPPIAPNTPGVTLTNFRSLHQGMSIVEMAKILGRQADHVFHFTVGGEGRDEHLWFGTEGVAVITQLPEAIEGYFRASAYSDADLTLLRRSRDAAFKERWQERPDEQESIWNLKLGP